MPNIRDECANNSRTACAELLILHLLRGSVVLGKDDGTLSSVWAGCDGVRAELKD